MAWGRELTAERGELCSKWFQHFLATTDKRLVLSTFTEDLAHSLSSGYFLFLAVRAEKSNISWNCSQKTQHSKGCQGLLWVPNSFLETPFTWITWWFLLGIQVNSAFHSQPGHKQILHWPGGQEAPSWGAQGQAVGPSSEDEAGTTAESILVLNKCWRCCAVFNFLVKILPGARDSRSL